MNPYIRKLMKIVDKHGFNPFINSNEELILCKKTNLYFNLVGVATFEDVVSKLLEYCSRDAYKSQPFATNKRNEIYHKEVTSIINEFLGTDFNEDDMELIYTELGNGINHQLALDFINSNFDMNVLKEVV